MSISQVNFSNMTNPIDMLAAANTHSGGMFWSWSLFIFITVLGLGLMQFGGETALLVALFGGMVVGTLMFYMGLIGIGTVGIIVGALLFLIIYMIATSRQNQ